MKIIWYEVDESEDAIGLFTRLNIGKIPLTNAELVKAIFLCRDNNDSVDNDKQQEISLQWDNIEKELHNDSLWYFLTNKTNTEYQTRIDLVLDLLSRKPADNRDKYFTFFEFDNMRKTRSLDDLWIDIQKTFLMLKDWHEDHELYHKIGYLIASDTLSLQEIYAISEGKTKSQFRGSLDDYIKKSITFTGKNKELIHYADLSYERSLDYGRISKLLLLFNVESVRKNGEQSQWFPFDKFKFSNGKKVAWSLEHIHAQNSEGMRTQEVWREWIKLHIDSIESLGDDNEALLDEMRAALSDDKLERTQFESIQSRVTDLLSAAGSTEYMHCIANMALLNSGDNAALNNSTFDVKRNDIIKMDKKGQYIPFCTKMVFLKYYTPSAKNQIHFWGQADRVAYIDAINDVLKDYLPEKLEFNWEEA